MPTINKYRTIHPLGYVEFLTLADAEAYRDANHPGCEIVEVTEEPTE